MNLFMFCVFLCGGATLAQAATVPETSKFGRILTIGVDGYFHPVIDIGGAKFKEGMKRIGIMDDTQLLQVGRESMNKLTDLYGIDTNFVKDNHILHNPAKVNNTDQSIQFETGMMGPNTNIHLKSEAVWTKDGRTAGRKPQHSVRFSFFYMKLKCMVATCTVTNGTVPMGTEALVQWLVPEQSDMDAGYNFYFQVVGGEMFFISSPIHTDIAEGMLRDKVTSPQFGDGTICGLLEINKKEARKDVMPPRPKIKLHYQVIFPDLLDSLPDWPTPQAPVTPVACGHWACLPALSADTDETQLSGRELTINADGYFVRNTDKNVYRRILKAAGLDTDQKVIDWGRDALKFFNDQFNIDMNSYVSDNVLLHNPPEAQQGVWKVEVGAMDTEASNIQITSAGYTDKTGKSVLVVPSKRVLASFVFIRATCIADSCPVSGGITVPLSSRAIVQWLVTEGSGEIQVKYMSRTFDMFRQYSYLDENIARGLVKNRGNSTEYGECETNGNMEINKNKVSVINGEKAPKLSMCYVITCNQLLDKLPSATPSGSVTTISSVTLVMVAMVTCLVTNYLGHV